jgi:hypothetical protein
MLSTPGIWQFGQKQKTREIPRVLLIGANLNTCARWRKRFFPKAVRGNA